FRAIVHDRCVTKHHRACRRSTSWSVRTAFHGLAFHNIIPATAASHDPHHDPRTHCGAARRDAATRHLRMHRAHRRSAPFRVPAGALASPRMAFGLHRLGWNIGGDAKLCRVVDRLALLLASRTPARRQRRGTGEIERAAYTGTREWLCAGVQVGDKVACAADMLSLASERSLRKALAKHGAELVDDDLPGAIWTDRPPPPHAPVYEHPIDYAIHARAEKLADVREAMQRAGATHHVVSALDEIAWVLNLRGSDVEYNPVFLAHLLIDANGATLFVEASKLDADLKSALANDGVHIAPYESIGDDLRALPRDSTLLLSSAQVSAAVARAIPDHFTLIE